MTEHPLLQIHDSPEPLGDQPEADLVITTFHGTQAPEGPLKDFMARHESTLDPRDAAVFEDYLNLEVDSFSSELAWRVFQLLQQADPSLRLRYLDFRAQRGILDMNRGKKEDARRKLWLPDDEPLWEELGQLHSELMEAFEQAVPLNAFEHALDVHTMYPYSPVLSEQEKASGLQTVREGRGSLDAYIRDYREAKERGGRKRPLDLLTRDDFMRYHANEDWVNRLKIELNATSHHYAENDPYDLGGLDLTGKRLVARTRSQGVLVDIPKSLFVSETDPRIFSPAQLDGSRLEVLAKAITASYLEARAHTS